MPETKVTILIKAKDLASKTIKGLGREMKTFGQRVSGGFTKATGSMKSFIFSMKGLATGIVAVMALKFGKHLLNLAANVVETASKFDAVFGPAADALVKRLDRFRRIAGLTSNELKGLAAHIGSIVKGLGFSTDAAASMSEQVLKLAGDLGSFNNMETAEVAEAVASALVGETERMKRLGIVIRQTDIINRALADSGKRTAAELTNQERATAALTLVTEKAGQMGALGDLERTSNSLANRMRQLSARMREIKEILAVSLLPVFESLFDTIIANQDLIDQFAESLQTFGEIVGEVFDPDRIKRTREEIKKFSQELIEGDIRATRVRADNLRELEAKQREATQALLDQVQRSAPEFITPQQRRELRDAQAELRETQRELVVENERLNDLLAQQANFATAEAEAAERTATATRDAAETRERDRDPFPFAGATGRTGDEVVLQEPPEIAAPGMEPAGVDLGGMSAEEINARAMELANLNLSLEQMIALLQGVGLSAAQAGAVMQQFGANAEEAGSKQDAFKGAGEIAGNAAKEGAKFLATSALASNKSIADVAKSKAKFELAEGVADIAAGLWPPNPVALGAAAEHFAAAAAFAAIGKAAGGGGGKGGGAGGGGGAGFREQQRGAIGEGRGEATLIIEGGLLDMNDPRQEESFRNALEELSGRNVIVQSGD
jgi:hypothetical protein